MFLAVSWALAQDDANAWERLYDARLVEAADGTPEVAVLFYEELKKEMDAGDPLYGQTCYWLGRARFNLGQVDLAVEALREAARDVNVRPQANAFLALIELESRRVTTLPRTMHFEDGVGSFVRAGETAAKGALATRDISGNDVLAWATTVVAAETDRVSMALEVSRFEHLSFRVRATSFPAELRVVLSDGAGSIAPAPVLRVQTGSWLMVDIPVRGVVRLVEIVDTTGVNTDRRGQNVLLIDDVEVR